MKDGAPIGADAEKLANEVLKRPSYSIELTLGDGPGTFAYLTSDKAPAYRAVMAAFVAAKERFRLHLRPEEIATALSPQPVEPLLTQLVDWGNLIAHQDYAEVQRVARMVDATDGVLAVALRAEEIEIAGSEFDDERAFGGERVRSGLTAERYDF